MRNYTHLGTLLLLLFANSAARGGDPPAVWISKVGSDKPSEFRIAQVYLSRLESAPLDKLDELAKTADGRLKQRMKEVVALMLLNGIELREVQRRRHLYALCKVEFATARKLADQLRKAITKAERDNPNAAEGVQWYLLDEKASDLHLKLHRLHGWGVPALVKLTESKSPFLKMTAIDTLVSHGGRLPPSVLKRLKNDKTPLVRFYGDYSLRSTIAKEIASVFKSHPYLAKKPSFADWHRTLALLHQFEKIKLPKDRVLTSFEPKWSFDEYWRAAQRDMVRVWDDR